MYLRVKSWLRFESIITIKKIDSSNYAGNLYVAGIIHRCDSNVVMMWLRCCWYLRFGWYFAEMWLRLAEMWLRCCWVVAEMWRICGWDVAEMWLICSWVVAELLLRCGWDVANMWLTFNHHAEIWSICCWYVARLWFRCGWDVDEM